MTQSGKAGGQTGGKAEKWAARGKRLSAALRENLKRRKEQARGRENEREQGREKTRQQATAPEVGRELDQQTASNSPPPAAETRAPPEFRRNQVHE
jgi:hypothetical protein